MPLGSVEIALAWNSDFSLAANGDLVLAQDVTGNVAATTQRIILLILSNFRSVNATTGVVSPATDPFNPNYGAGVRTSLGAGIDANLAATIEAQITSALAADPDIQNVPAPVVTVTQSSANIYAVYVSVTCYALTGEIITIPSLPLTAGT